MFVVDTTVIVDYLRGYRSSETDHLDRRLGRERIGIVDLAIAEVSQGVHPDALAYQIENVLQSFHVLHVTGPDLIREAARMSRALDCRGRQVTDIVDLLTAALCLREGYSLLHSDWAFEQCRKCFGLKTETWRPEFWSLPRPEVMKSAARRAMSPWPPKPRRSRSRQLE